MAPRTRPSGDLWIVEPSGSGHRFWYVRLLLDALDEPDRARARVVTTPAAAASAEWRVHLTGVGTPPLVRAAGRGWLAAVLRESRAAGAYVVLPDADRALPTLLRRAWRRDQPLTGRGLLMRMRPQSGIRGAGAFAAKLAAAAALKLVAPGFVLCSLELAPEGQHPLAGVLRIPPVCDPVAVDPRPVSRREWFEAAHLIPDEPVFLVIGDLSARKCVPEILAAWELLGAQAPQLALVGRADRDTAQAVAQLPDATRRRVSLQQSYLNDQDFDTWISQSDAVLVLHRNEGSSGVLLRSAAMNKTTLVGGARSVRAAHAALRLHGAVVGIRPASIAAAVADLAASASSPSAGSDPPAPEFRWRLGTAGDFAAALLPGHGTPAAASRGTRIDR